MSARHAHAVSARPIDPKLDTGLPIFRRCLDCGSPWPKAYIVDESCPVCRGVDPADYLGLYDPEPDELADIEPLPLELGPLFGGQS